MDLSFSLENFRAFEKTEDISLSPITVLCGSNSSGKSSLLKLLLLYKQSTQLRNSDYYTPFGSNPILLNGNLVRLGSWTDVIHNKHRDEGLSISWNVLCDSGEDIPTRLRDPEISKWLGRLDNKDIHNFSIRTTFMSSDEVELERSVYIHTIDFVDHEKKYNLQLKNKIGSRIGVFEATISSLKNFIVSNKVPFENRMDKDTASIVKRIKDMNSFQIDTGRLLVAFNGPHPNDFYYFLNKTWRPFLKKILQKLRDDQKSRKGKVPSYIDKLASEVRLISSDNAPSDLEEAAPISTGLVRLISDHFDRELCASSALLALAWRRIRYLGPLREEPKRYYQFDDAGENDIGTSGEYSVQVLSLEKNSTVDHTTIEHIDDNRIELSSEPQRTTLIEALNYWMDFLDLPSVWPRNIEQSLYSLNVEAREDLSLSLQDVGFGVSQVLPIVLECLRAKQNDLVILEQPEIHLHPSIQSRLADFFIARSADGIKFMIESHSEYIVKRLCRRLAEGDTCTKDRVNLQFIQDSGFGHSQCTKLEMNEFGEIQNWPSGFFDTSDDISWAKASLEKRRSNVTTKPSQKRD